MTLSPQSPLDTIAGVRAEGEVGVHRDTQDFRGSVQRNHRVTNWHLRVECGPGLEASLPSKSGL